MTFVQNLINKNKKMKIEKKLEQQQQKNFFRLWIKSFFLSKIPPLYESIPFNDDTIPKLYKTRKSPLGISFLRSIAKH